MIATNGGRSLYKPLQLPSVVSTDPETSAVSGTIRPNLAATNALNALLTAKFDLHDRPGRYCTAPVAGGRQLSYYS